MCHWILKHCSYRVRLNICKLTHALFYSAKDKIILEDAYKSNPKPDKQARLDIVNRVSLNEKEVQVRRHFHT